MLAGPPYTIVIASPCSIYFLLLFEPCACSNDLIKCKFKNSSASNNCCVIIGNADHVKSRTSHSQLSDIAYLCSSGHGSWGRMRTDSRPGRTGQCTFLRCGKDFANTETKGKKAA